MELIGLLLPVLVDLINRRVANSDARFWVSVLVCAIFGILLNWLNTAFVFATPLEAFNSITASIMVTFGLAQLSYKAVWEESKARVKAFGLGVAGDQKTLEK